MYAYKLHKIAQSTKIDGKHQSPCIEVIFTEEFAHCVSSVKRFHDTSITACNVTMMHTSY